MKLETIKIMMMRGKKIISIKEFNIMTILKQ